MLSRSLQRFRRNAHFAICSSVGAAMLLAAAPLAHASTVRRTSVEQMLAASELVFEGRVVESWAEDGPRGIHTWVRFEILDVVKGPAVGPTLALSFQGGEVGDVRDEIVGLRMPPVGEHGLYFVESLGRFQVNPLYGWDQGRLLVVPDGRGRSRITSALGRPVVAIAPPGARSRPRSPEAALGFVVDGDADLSHALSAESLKGALRSALPATGANR